MPSLKDKIKNYKRREKRVQLVGAEGVNIQDRRRRKVTTDRGMSRDVQQRMKEYKSGKVIDKVKRYKHPDNK